MLVAIGWWRLTRVLVAGLLLWVLPMSALAIALGWERTLIQMAWLFTKAALLTFGGAYAVLPYVYQGPWSAMAGCRRRR
jgi:chromate transporter